MSRLLLLFVGAAAVGLALLADAVFSGEPGFGAQQVVLLTLGSGAMVTACLPSGARRRVVTAACASALALLVGEGIARVFLAPGFTTIYQVDADCLYTLRPGSAKRFVHRGVNGGHTISVRINSQGYRGAELEPKGERRRIVVFGDSFIEAEFSRLEDTFVERLGAKLGDGVQVVNAGVVAYGPDQVLVRMRRELPALDADLVIVALYADNDFGDPLRNKLFRLDETGGLVAHSFSLAPALVSQFTAARKGWVLERAWRRAFGGFGDEPPLTEDETTPELETARMEEWLARSKAEYEDYVVRGDPEVREIFEDHYDADVSFEPSSPSALYKRELLRAIASAMRRAADGAGTRLFFVVIPSRLDVCESFDLGWIDPARWPDWRRESLSTAAEGAARLAGAPVINLFEPFRAGGACALYLRGGDLHWNEQGQELAARLAAERIRSEVSFASVGLPRRSR